MDLTHLQGSFASLPTDWIIVGVLLIASAFDSFRNGTGRTIAITLSFLLALILVEFSKRAFFVGALLHSSTASYVEPVFFGIVVVMLFGLLRRITTDNATLGATPLSCLLASVAAVSVLLLVWMQTPALTAIWHFGPLLQSAFAAPYALWWMIGSLFILSFTSS